jgi:alkylation response protein AidB-like acyl-CoA dehydrogenase
MDFDLSDEQRLIQDTVRAFVDERMLPNAIENDINHHLDMSVIEGRAGGVRRRRNGLRRRGARV